MKVALCVISDRRDLYLPECLRSLAEYADYDFSDHILVDDRDHRLGLAGAVNAAWDRAHDADFLLHWEEDFLATEFVDIEGMAYVLTHVPYLAQMVLKRQPWSPEEHKAGGIIEQYPDEYKDRDTDGFAWVEHHRIFSLNPCLIPRWVFTQGWPAGNEAEQTVRFTGKSFGYWGKREDPPRVQHIGAERSVGWRL